MSMQDNTQNNWKILLENTGSSSGETIRDKDEIWEKLYSRLHKRPQRKLKSWYWVAACFLTVALGTVMFFVSKQKHHPGLATVSSGLKEQKITGTEGAPGIEQKKEAVTLSRPKQKKDDYGPYKKNKTIKIAEPIYSNLLTDCIFKHLPELVHPSNVVYDSINKSIIASAPVKKKLKVIHLNEIGQPADEPTVNSRFADRVGFGSRIINSETYNPTFGSSSNNGLILIKPHNTSN